MKLSIDKIIVSKDNPRQNFDEEGLRKLGESILSHGQIQQVVVRTRGSNYELISGERRLRAMAMVGLTEINVDVREMDDATAMELRLIENTHREDLTSAEKGDAVLALWALGKYKTFKEVAEVIKVPYETVKSNWLPKARKLSEFVKESVWTNTLGEQPAQLLLKYPHSVQDKLAKVIIDNDIKGDKVRDFLKLYDENPNSPLEELLGRTPEKKEVVIPAKFLTPELQQKIEEETKKESLVEEAKQLSKVKRIRKEPSKRVTKDEIKEKLKKKTEFKFVVAKVTHGTGEDKPLKQTIQPIVIPNPETPDYTLCKCATCELFAKQCKGRCWE